MKTLNDFQLQSKCLECKNRSGNHFCNLRENSLKVIESLKITHKHPKGAILFMEGQPSTGVYILCKGKVKLSTCSRDGKIIILHIAEPGEILGLSSSVTDSLHISTAEAMQPCQVNFIRNEDFLRFLRENADACLSAVKQLGNNYNTAYMQICSLGLSTSVADKLATLFLGWCKLAAEGNDGIHLKITYTHEEIAEMIGTSRETVTRILKEFKQQHLITRKGADLIIHDKKKLENFVSTKKRAKL